MAEINTIEPEPTPLPEIVKQCCICTRKDTKLLHLCLVNGGGNSLFSLLCDDQDDTPDGNKEPTRLIICWECDAILSKIMRFRQQVCKAQKRLSSIAEGRTMAQNTFLLIPPMSDARGSGPDAILEYRLQTLADPSQPLLRVVRYVLPDGSDATLPPPRGDSGHQSSLLELLEGIHQYEFSKKFKRHGVCTPNILLKTEKVTLNDVTPVLRLFPCMQKKETQHGPDLLYVKERDARQT